MKARRSFFRSVNLQTYTMLAPALAFILAVMAFPLIYSFARSLEYRGQFVGLRNYLSLLSTPAIQATIGRSALLVVVCVTAEMLLGFAFALLLNRRFPGRSLARTLFLLPLLVPPVVAALNWSWLLNTEFGAVNHFLQYFLPWHRLPLWLADPSWAFVSVAAATVWRNTPFVMILILAGLQAVDRQLLEAAAIDGASRIKAFFYVTLPSLRQILIITVMLRIIDLFRVFDTVFVMTQGGPGGATEILSTRVYKFAFWEAQMEMASALAYIALILTLIWLVPLLWVSRGEGGT